MLDLRANKLYDSEKEYEGRAFLDLWVLGINEGLWAVLRRGGSGGSLTRGPMAIGAHK